MDEMCKKNNEFYLKYIFVLLFRISIVPHPLILALSVRFPYIISNCTYVHISSTNTNARHNRQASFGPLGLLFRRSGGRRLYFVDVNVRTYVHKESEKNILHDNLLISVSGLHTHIGNIMNNKPNKR